MAPSSYRPPHASASGTGLTDNGGMRFCGRILLVSTLAAGIGPAADVEVIERIVAKVNGEIITTSELAKNRRTIEAELKRQGASGDAMQCLSMVRLGVCLGLVSDPDLSKIHKLMLLTQPAHLQRIVQKELDQAARRGARARLIRSMLSPGPAQG